jgi:hypothetical protein
MSYYEKMEMLKRKIIDTHRKVDSLQNPEVKDFLNKAKSQRVQLQPAHPDWAEE